MRSGGEADLDGMRALPASASYIDKGIREEGVESTESAELEVLEGEVVGPEGSRAGTGLVLMRQPPRDEHPIVVYLASLSEGSRRAMWASLENIARFLSGGEADAFGLAWHKLRYQHTAFVRSQLSASYAPATANKMLSALRGVLKECFRLGYITAEDYGRARDLAPVRAPLSHRAAPSHTVRSGGSSKLVPKTTKRGVGHGAPPWWRCSTGVGSDVARRRP